MGGLGAAQCELHNKFYSCKEAVGYGGYSLHKKRCIFPFYVDRDDGMPEFKESCDLFGEPSFIVPVWRCPVFNISRKHTDSKYSPLKANHFTKSDYENTTGLCLRRTSDPDTEGSYVLDPDIDCKPSERFRPFSTCS